MANQIVISSGAKVRNLNGVLTGTTGVVDALGINVANGIPQFAFADNETMFQRWIDRRNTLLNEIRRLVVSLAFHG